MRFEFSTAQRIIFGCGTVSVIGDLAKSFGQRALVVTGNEVKRAQKIWDALIQSEVEGVSFSVPKEPTTDIVALGSEKARKMHCDLVIGCGGGSVVDAAKAIAVLMSNGGTPLDYLEVIGSGKPIAKPAVPCIAVPSTAGTGAEVTKNAVLVSEKHRVKVSLRSDFILPRIAIIDPELTYSMSPDLTSTTGLDAFTQIIEPYVSIFANPLTDALCRDGIRLAGKALMRAYTDGQDKRAREEMALVSLYGGLALANAKLGAVHGFAGVLGGMFDAPHGAICGQLLPYVMETNILALEKQDRAHPALARYAEIANIVLDTDSGTAEDAVAWMKRLVTNLRIQGLGKYGIKRESFSQIVEKAMRSSSMKGNPIQLTESELHLILEKAF